MVSLTSCVVSFIALDNEHDSGVITTYGGSALVVGAVSAALLLRRTAPAVTVVFALLSTLASDDATPLIFATYALGAYDSRGRWLLLGVVGLLYGLTRWWVTAVPPDASAVVYLTITAVWFPAALGDLTRRRREATRLLRQRLVAVEHAIDQAARQAVVDERTRLAFDIHDGIGHQAIVLTLQARALRTCPGLPDKAVELSSTIEESARVVLEDLRDILDVLNGSSDRRARGGPAFAQFAAALVANLTAAGIDASYRQSGQPRPLPAQVDEVLRDCGREALTNAVKHGGGVPVSIGLDFTADEVCLEVRNGVMGAVSPRHDRSGGIGMASMSARVAGVGGRFQASSTPEGGFRVRIVLPAKRQPVAVS
ncbi:sensor histidine kinase [Streptomyces sp. NPDC058579]|uniref:sensor histidine kinase n=1 Tax=Streptomyces sp. NPDC058579 TaxID=3346548 RepID=UPI003653EBEC